MINNNSNSLPYRSPLHFFVAHSLLSRSRLIDLRVGIFPSLDLSFELILINNFSSPYASSSLSLSLFAALRRRRFFFFRVQNIKNSNMPHAHINAGRWSKRLNRPQTCSVAGGGQKLHKKCADKLWQICIMK
jgi:hypothetical protein